MCRFLIVKSKQKIKPEALLKSFALTCQKSVAPDGALQKDGYGIAWQDGGSWQLKKSLSPIWEELEQFGQVPETNLFVAHARSATFSKDKDNLEFNQPFIDKNLCFVFNGMIRRISFNLSLEGQIGSQKLFSLIKLLIKKHKTSSALEEVKNFVLKKAEKVEGMNIGLVDGNKIYILSQYSKNKDYFSLYYYNKNKNLTIISSESFDSFNWKIIERGSIFYG